VAFLAVVIIMSSKSSHLEQRDVQPNPLGVMKRPREPDRVIDSAQQARGMTVLADAHVHLFRAGPRRSDIAAYEQLRSRFMISRALVVGYEGAGGPAGNNRSILAWAQSRPWLACLAYAPPAAPPTAQQWAELARNGFVGISVYCTTYEQAEALRRWPAELIDGLEASRAIISVNAPVTLLNAVSELAARAPRCAMLVSHLGLPARSRDGAPAGDVPGRLQPLLELGTRPGVGVKLSGFYALGPAATGLHPLARPIVRALLDAFGAHRLYWGSDFPSIRGRVSFEDTIGCVTATGIPEAALPAVFGDNLVRLLAARVDQPTGA